MPKRTSKAQTESTATVPTLESSQISQKPIEFKIFGLDEKTSHVIVALICLLLGILIGTANSSSKAAFIRTVLVPSSNILHPVAETVRIAGKSNLNI